MGGILSGGAFSGGAFSWEGIGKVVNGFDLTVNGERNIINLTLRFAAACFMGNSLSLPPSLRLLLHPTYWHVRNFLAITNNQL